MTISYMFRAKDRPTAKDIKTEGVAALHAGLSEAPAIFVPHPRFRITDPAAPTEPAPPTVDHPEVPITPLLLVNPTVVPLQPAPAPIPEQVVSEVPAPDLAAPVSAGLPVPYERTDARIILVAKARGGIGATTLAVNLALEMQLQAAKRAGAAGGRVALVDLDVQLGNAGTFLDLADRGGMLALARLAAEPDTQAVRHAMVRHASGLSVLAAPTTAIPFEALDPMRVASILDALTVIHDVVIVDLPPALIDWLSPVLQRAERMLMVTDLAVPSIARARRIITLMKEDRPDLPVEIVVAHEKKPFRLGHIHRDAAMALGHDLRHWLPEETRLARQALDRGEALVQLAPRSVWSRAIRHVAAGLQSASTTTRKDR